ncbi:triose-phosphate isomerase [Berryella wangjianweii]|uniref:Triosephosphate isomerase n=1 Tax=Berryella wangjianweii TaxID=2734634 RepID=A0A6M8J616_9ACTN|nr:triose-phosphate isomerase [Berryella wangjianweii]QKF07118.1 triose-phosphate isomerase [Berryella wangjianweii]
MRIPLIAGNWKMNLGIAEGVVLSQNICNNFDKSWLDRVDVLVCPPAIGLRPCLTVFEFERLKVQVGAQNVHWQPQGAYTGELSCDMLASAGCTAVIVGHSERRNLFGETNEQVNLKLRAVLAQGMTPIACVGESLAVREGHDPVEYVCAQVDAALAGIDEAEAARCVIAYEPVWAIGTGRTATPEQAQQMCAAIRALVADRFGSDVAEQVRVLYGGSVNVGNIDALIVQPDIDGALVGGASLEASSFLALIKACASHAGAGGTR